VQSHTSSDRLMAKTSKAIVLFLLLAFQSRGQFASSVRDADAPFLSTLRQLYGETFADGQAIVSFRIQGVVCAIPNTNGTIVLQDNSASVLLELPPFKEPVKPGDCLMLEGTNCTVTRGAFGLEVATAPVVNADGSRGTIRRSGKAFLDSGAVPIRVEWFNDYGGASLQIDYDGPGVKRRNIPASLLFHRAENQTTGPFLKPGLDYTSYVGNGWKMLPDFQKATKAGTGIATGFDIKLRARPNQCAMVFSGLLQVSNAGIYTFHVASDDGCRLFLGDASAHLRVSVISNSIQQLKTNNLSETMSEDGDQQWSHLDGKVILVREQPGLIELEVGLGQRSLTAALLSQERFTLTNLIGSHVRMSGIYQRTWTGSDHWPARLLVPGLNCVQVVNETNLIGDGGALTFISQIRELAPDQSKKHLPVHIRGIITMETFWFCILQDASGGIYLPYSNENWVKQPRPGEVWEFTGTTDAGDFSPVVTPKTASYVGPAALPQGIRPTWSDFQNGDLDAEQVDIEAAVIDVSDSKMTLLTRDGMVTLLGDVYRPLPRNPATGTSASLKGNVVRLRGVFTADWDSTNRLVKPRIFLLGNVSVSVIEPASTNWFLAPLTPVRDLLQFRSPTVNWGRVKVAGVVLHAEPREYVLSDGSSSIRVYTRDAETIHDGDWVEAAGYSQIGGPSPTLLEAQIQKKGSAALPKPIVIARSALPNRSDDAKLVQLEALLLSDTMQQTERVLELQTGQSHFLAKLSSETRATATIRPGTLLKLTGVCSSLGSRQALSSLDAFELLLNRPSDIVVIRRAPWWTPQRILTLAVMLAVGLMLALTWAALLRRTVARRTLQLKQETENRRLIEQQSLLDQERSRVAQDLHDELGARLAEVGILGTLANNPDISREKQEGYLNRLAELGRMLVSGLDEIVWAVNPKHDSNEAVSGYLCDYAQDFLLSADISCGIDIARPWPDHIFTSQDRHQLFLAFREALTNVVKHARASEVCVRIGEDTRSLWVAVEDNGKGLASIDHKGDGLTNMSNRMKRIGGECEVSARPGGGTIVTLRIFTSKIPKI
jgi:signal transduction histidine kinase